MSADALVFDFGNVLVDIDFGRAFAAWGAAAGVPAATLAARFAPDEAYCAHERGEMSEAEYFAHLRGSLGLALPDEALLAGWNAIFGAPLPGVEALVERLAGAYPLYVFSNTNPAHVAHFKPRYERLLGFFRRIITSCEIGERKPEPEAFRRLMKLVDGRRVVFFDDLEENVLGARAAGLEAFRVAAAGDIARVLGQKRSAR